MSLPRAVGVRMGYHQVPDRVRAWVDGSLGSPVVAAEDQVGGMSPGCAARVRCADGRRAFVKAVGAELNPVTPDLFRREARVLALMGDDPLWASLHDVLDEPDGWVALVLEDIPGPRPDLGAEPALDRLAAATDELSATLRARVPVLPAPTADPGPAELPGERAVLTKWSAGLENAPDVSPELMPRWLVARLDGLRDDCARLVDACTEDRLVHWDIRDDNLRTRPDGSLVFVDWGGACRGSAWTDPLICRLEGVESTWFDRSLADSPALRDLGDDLVTAFLVMIGSYLAHRAEIAVDVNLPTLNDFRITESRRFLAGAARRLGISAPTSI